MGIVRLLGALALLAVLPGQWRGTRRTTVANAATPYDTVNTFRIAPGSLIRVFG